MRTTTRRTLVCPMLAVATVVLGACATDAPKPPVPAALTWCDTDLARHGVVVTARGTRLALRPATARLQRASLQRASLNDRVGSAVLTCRPQDGALTSCVVLYEDPDGEGFGKLALGYADRVIYPSDVDDGVTAEVRFHFDNTPHAAKAC